MKTVNVILVCAVIVISLVIIGVSVTKETVSPVKPGIAGTYMVEYQTPAVVPGVVSVSGMGAMLQPAHK